MIGAARVLVWNIEWKGRRSRAGRTIADIIASADPDVIVLTEAPSGFLDSEQYHIAEADADYGYGLSDRRKVIIASKRPWSDATPAEDSALPSGRFVGGVTETPIGALHVTGVCVPWSRAHVSSGRSDRQPWEDHRAFLNALRPCLPPCKGNAIVAGDFNQTLPRTTAPAGLDAALLTTLADYRIATRDIPDADGKLYIDHIALRGNLTIGALTHLSRRSEGDRLSDHSGFVATIGGSEAAAATG